MISGNDEHYPKPPSASKSSSRHQVQNMNMRQKRQADEQNVRLYNIKEDPEELIELSATHPEIVDQLLERLAFYNSTAVPVLDLPVDIGHSPDQTGGAWVPWVTEEL